MRRKPSNVFLLFGAASLMSVIAIGCGTTRIVDPLADDLHNDATSISAVNKEIADREVVLEWLDGKTLRAQEVVLKRDSVSFTGAVSRLRRTAPMDSLREVRWANRLAGAIEGGCFAALPAVLIGRGINLNVNGSGRDNSSITGGLAVFGVGTVLGLMIGEWHTYEIQKRPASIP
jgi:hypothetical protein